MSRLVVRDPEIVKELMITNHESLKRPQISDKIASVVAGKGLLIQRGEKWTIERRTATPFFHQDALKVSYESKSLKRLHYYTFRVVERFVEKEY